MKPVDLLLAATLGFAIAFDPTPRVNAAPSPSPHPHAKPHPSPTPAIVDEGQSSSAFPVAWSYDAYPHAVEILMRSCSDALQTHTDYVGEVDKEIAIDADLTMRVNAQQRAEISCHLGDDKHIVMTIRTERTSDTPPEGFAFPVLAVPTPAPPCVTPSPSPEPSLPPGVVRIQNGGPCSPIAPLYGKPIPVRAAPSPSPTR
ncbi:MAG: hypothetical protein IAI48_00490 [Candidatus Eremiobacteraeota bacterium]|nr:hypothetical protein [Candidatus Eremiobacteraeota bacterium]